MTVSGAEYHHRHESRKRRLLRLILLVGALSVTVPLLVSCSRGGPNEPQPSTEAAKKPKKGLGLLDCLPWRKKQTKSTKKKGSEEQVVDLPKTAVDKKTTSLDKIKNIFRSKTQAKKAPKVSAPLTEAQLEEALKTEAEKLQAAKDKLDSCSSINIASRFYWRYKKNKLDARVMKLAKHLQHFKEREAAKKPAKQKVEPEQNVEPTSRNVQITWVSAASGGNKKTTDCDALKEGTDKFIEIWQDAEGNLQCESNVQSAGDEPMMRARGGEAITVYGDAFGSKCKLLTVQFDGQKVEYVLPSPETGRQTTPKSQSLVEGEEELGEVDQKPTAEQTEDLSATAAKDTVPQSLVESPVMQPESPSAGVIRRPRPGRSGLIPNSYSAPPKNKAGLQFGKRAHSADVSSDQLSAVSGPLYGKNYEEGVSGPVEASPPAPPKAAPPKASPPARPKAFPPAPPGASAARQRPLTSVAAPDSVLQKGHTVVDTSILSKITIDGIVKLVHCKADAAHKEKLNQERVSVEIKFTQIKAPTPSLWCHVMPVESTAKNTAFLLPKVRHSKHTLKYNKKASKWQFKQFVLLEIKNGQLPMKLEDGKED